MSLSSPAIDASLNVLVHQGEDALKVVDRWTRLRRECGAISPSYRHEWLAILREGLGHTPYCLEVSREDETLGLMPLAFVQSILFGRFLVGMPYLNVGGVLSQDRNAGAKLISQAVELADSLDVQYLELRHETRWEHPALEHELTEKVHMRLKLPDTSEGLWKQFKPKLRSQIRKAEKNGVTTEWGRENLLPEFYQVFSENMRDLGTPVFGRSLFVAILKHLGDDAEICVARSEGKPVAASLLVFGEGMVEVPSASSLRQHNRLGGNMLMYWQLLKRAIEREQQAFDFGRSTEGSNTYRFKSQWGAQPHPAVWQYYLRKGSLGQMRPDNPKQQRRIALWKRLPLWLTRLAGPPIVRGIP